MGVELFGPGTNVTVNNADFPASGTTSRLDTANSHLSNILAQLDDATADTVIGVLKSILAELGEKTEGQTVAVSNADFPATGTTSRLDSLLTELQAKLEAGQSINVGNFPATQTVDGTVSVGNLPTDGATDTTLRSVLAQLDDATADTVLSVLKSILTELGAKYEGGNIAVSNADHPASGIATETTLKEVRDRLPSGGGLASESTLADLRDNLGTPVDNEAASGSGSLISLTKALRSNTETMEALLTTIRDEQYRRTDPLAAGTNVVGKVQLDQAASHFISSAGMLEVEYGRFFIGGRAIELGGVASTDRAVFRLHNPSTSGKNIYVMMVAIYSSVTQQVKYNEDGTITAEGTITPMNLNRALGANTPASVAELTYAKTAITGGTEWPNESRVFNTSPLPINFSNSPVKLGPGKSLLVRGTVGDAQVFTINAYWVEKSI